MNVQMFGSCRINFPLEILSKKSEINLKKRWWGFTHYTKEIIQIFNSFVGSMPSDSYFGIINWEHLNSQQWAGNPKNRSVLDDVDVVVIEISSVKTFSTEGVYLQTNRIVDEFSDYSDLFPNWPFFAKDEKLFGVISEQILDSDKRKILNGLSVDNMSLDEIKSDLLFINDFLKFFGVKKVICVTHFSYGIDGSIIPGRKAVVDDLIDVCRSIKMPVFDPGLIVNERGADKMLIDSVHYSDFGKQVVADKLLKFIRG
jgi:hypothetical protein